MNDNPVSVLSLCMGHALHAEDGLSDIQYQKKDWVASREKGEDVSEECVRKHRPEEVAVAGMFIQHWGSTALGFGGIGGAAMTDAYTVVLRSRQTFEHLVYFGGRFAYKITKPNESFLEDMRTGNMNEVSAHGKYERTFTRMKNS